MYFTFTRSTEKIILYDVDFRLLLIYVVFFFIFFVFFYLFYSYFFFFFFSSRRRHTRSLRDWSSDVCSSDLRSLSTWARSTATWWPDDNTNDPAGRNRHRRHGRARNSDRRRRGRWRHLQRSEERRVGKECRSRWSPEHEKKNGGTNRRRRNRD